MAQPLPPPPKQGEVCSDIFKATQDIAAQAAQRAQERLQKVREPPASDVPEIPARSSGVFQKAPDIPPKKFAASNVPPPLPQKPQARSEHNNNNNNINNNNNGVYAQAPGAYGEMPKPRLDYLPQVPSRNAVDKNSAMQQQQQHPPPPHQMAVMKNGNTNGQLELNKLNKHVPNNKINHHHQHHPHQQQQQQPLSPTEDTSSEDALRGIECGLRNMERAMQEQLTLRSMEAAAAADNSNFNVSEEFRAGLRNIGSLSSFEGLTPPQYMMGPNNNNNLINNNNNTSANSMGFMGSNGTGRSGGMERGISMDQMRLDSQLRSLDSTPPNIRNANEEIKMKQSDVNGGNGKPRPIEQHMRSLDRNLPLELQYSRNHRQQQLQQQQLLLQQQLVSKVMNAPDPNRHLDMLNQFISRPNAMGPPQNAGAPSTGQGPVPNMDMKLRRRSSHDENQMLQSNPAGPGILQA